MEEWIMPKQKSPLDTMLRYWPVLLSLIGLVGFCYTLNIRVANAEDKNRSQDDWLKSQSASTNELKIGYGRMEEKVSASYSILQELRADMKEDNRRGR